MRVNKGKMCVCTIVQCYANEFHWPLHASVNALLAIVLLNEIHFVNLHFINIYNREMLCVSSHRPFSVRLHNIPESVSPFGPPLILIVSILCFLMQQQQQQHWITVVQNVWPFESTRQMFRFVSMGRSLHSFPIDIYLLVGFNSISHFPDEYMYIPIAKR